MREKGEETKPHKIRVLLWSGTRDMNRSTCWFADTGAERSHGCVGFTQAMSVCIWGTWVCSTSRGPGCCGVGGGGWGLGLVGGYFIDTRLSFRSREVEGLWVLLENVAESVPWEERFVLAEVELIS